MSETRIQKPICGYCRKEFTGKMEESLDASMGCPTCGDFNIYGTR